LVDGGFANHDDIKTVQTGAGQRCGCQVYAPVPKPKKKEVDRHAPHPGDRAEVAEWRHRMATDEAKEIYKQRAATAECVNAQARNRGLVLLLVRGVQKVKAIALWFATVHNMARGFVLLPRPSLN
jgi:Transposase DDE domain